MHIFQAMYPRLLAPRLRDALGDTPVVLLQGARQSGKTTLVRAEAERTRARYLNLDDAGVLAAARSDPDGFVAGLDGPVVLDEIQRAPGLLLAIKASVDRQRTPGRFVLTGSANALLLPTVADALPGRMEVLTLWPLAQQEVENHPRDFVDVLFAPRLHLADHPPEPLAALVRRVVTGGFPEVLTRKDDARRDAWFGSYVSAIVQRDIRDLSNVDGATVVPRVLSALAVRAGSLLNVSDLSRDVATPLATLRRYLALLEATFLIRLLPAWGSVQGRRVAKRPKVLFVDSGLLAHHMGQSAERVMRDRVRLGGLLEVFCLMELCKAASWSRVNPALSYYRTHAGHEVDMVLEDRNGRTVGLEVKASNTVTPADFNGLRSFAGDCGERFHRGVVLYTGDAVVPFGSNLHAVPVGALWRA